MDALNAAIESFWDKFNDGPVNDDNILDLSPKATTVVLNSIGNGLLSAASRIDFTPIEGRDNLTVLVWANDPDDPEVVRDIARNINPKPVFDRFSNSYFPPT